MIRYQLACSLGHEFEGWFQSSAAYDRQAEDGQVACPFCGSQEVAKAIMAPNLAKGSGAGTRGPSAPDAAAEDAEHRLRDEGRSSAEYVGDRFAEEARRIHFAEAEPRHIYGEATKQEARALLEEGVPVFPLRRPPKYRS
jgi:hypothetical protein